MLSNRPIAQTTAQAYAIVKPDEALPSGDDRYVPLDAARGTRNAAQVLTDCIVAYESAFMDATPRDYTCCLVTGHRGCGKTTELYRLKEILIRENFPVVYFDAEAEFDLQKQNVSWWHVLLEMVWQIDEQLSPPPYNIRIPDDLRDAAAEWPARVVTKRTERRDMESSLETELGAEAGLPFFAKAKAVIKALIKFGSSTVKEIEQEAERQPNVLRHAVTDIINHVNETLKSQKRRSLVIIVDGLEKIPLRLLGDRLTSHNTLFIYSGNYLKTPPCHLVYTLPLALLSSEDVLAVFPGQPILMPMIHIRHRDGTEDGEALRLISEVIERRVAPTIFAAGVIQMLALASGGHIRDFLHLVRDAALSSEEQINEAAAKRAIANMTDLYNRRIQQEFIEPLDYVAQHATLPGSPHDGELVNRLLVMEYRNDDAWNALHPCVQITPKYVRSPRAKKEEANA